MSDIDTRLANRILLGLVIGAIAGAITLLIGGAVPAVLDGARWLATTVLDPIGQVFLRMLFFVVIPLVFASLAYGVVQLGELRDLGPLAGRTFALFFANMAIAATLGLRDDERARARRASRRGHDRPAPERVQRPGGAACREGRGPAGHDTHGHRRHVHAAQPVRRVRRQPAQSARRRAAAHHLRDPGGRRGPRPAARTGASASRTGSKPSRSS